MQEIEDIEDNLIVKMQDLYEANKHKVNELMNDYQAWNQASTVDRIHSTLARSSVGPALLWTI